MVTKSVTSEKIFCIGAHRTGTTSMAYILKALGYDVCPDGYGYNQMENYWDGQYNKIFELADLHNGFSGPPWNLGHCYRLVAGLYPTAKFILTVRPAQEWVNSLKRFHEHWQKKLKRLSAGHGADFFAREYHSPSLVTKDKNIIGAYRFRNNGAERYFADTGRLLLVDWRTFSWSQLCDFLGQPVVPDDIQVPCMRSWERTLNNKWRYINDPPLSYGNTEQPLICFTVSCWQRTEQLRLLLKNFEYIWNVDNQTQMIVTCFASKDMGRTKLLSMLDAVECPVRVTYLNERFCNGRGHNVAAEHVSSDGIICPITVDLRMPLDIASRIRQYTKEGHSFYGPKVNNADESGKLHRCDYAYSLISMFKSDFDKAGTFAENMKWGGDNEKPEGGEDVVLGRKLIKMGYKEVRPFARDLICRWHPRNVNANFYKTLYKYKKKPWWTLTQGPEEG